MKVLLHIDELNKWDMVLGNVKHMLESVENFTLEVAVNGEAVKMLQIGVAADANFDVRFFDLAERGVIFTACNNSLNKFKIDKDGLFTFVTVVPAGMVEIAKKQAAGFLYIKP